MKLAINKQTLEGSIVTDFEADKLRKTHRTVNVEFTGSDDFGGAHYRDVWGGTWRVTEMTGETSCTVGSMDRWS